MVKETDDGLLGKLEDVRDAFKRHLEEIGADQTASAPGDDRARTIELLRESVGSFNLTLERFKA